MKLTLALLFLSCCLCAQTPAVNRNSHAPQAKVNLSWNASPSPNIAHYDVYRGQQSGGPYIMIGSTTTLAFTDIIPRVKGPTPFYVVIAVDSTGAQSIYSNEVVSTVP